MKRTILFLLAFYPAILVGQDRTNFQIKNGKLSRDGLEGC